jgi:acetyltransferase-like isoleucine patch superfamily enzyme
LIGRLYPRLPLKRFVLRLVTLLEGGQMTSQTLRSILVRQHQVVVGAYAYGSLLDPSMSDPGTEIGPYASIGPNVRRIGAAHPMDHPFLHPYWYRRDLWPSSSVTDVERTGCLIGPGVWIGANATILPGCKSIGQGAVIGANAVVTGDVEAFAVVAGVPARPIGRRLDASTRARLESIEDWSLPPAELQERFERTGYGH